MERKEFKKIKKIMGKNFIGPEELLKLSSIIGFVFPKKKIPAIPFSEEKLRKIKNDCILILGIPGPTLNKMREIFGQTPEKSEPCFYSQDWYLNEKFAKEKTLDFKWYLLEKEVDKRTMGKNPWRLKRKLPGNSVLPSAILVAFTFFAYYFLNKKEILWSKNFIWCVDKDSNGDQIYVGRYKDPKGINKNGFNIHRHLLIRSCHGVLWQIKM